ncbi:MAG: hypothetical protein P1U63_12295 [Coxiellaceae bacterium]|nr:hypothetical protein [Coxiellaceae bacterium]
MRPRQPVRLSAEDNDDNNNVFEMVDMTLPSGGAVASADDRPEEVEIDEVAAADAVVVAMAAATAPPAPAAVEAVTMAAALRGLDAVGLKKGQHGWAQFQFATAGAARHFVSKNELHSERPGNTSQAKGFDKNRFSGLFTVRTSAHLYVLLQSKIDGLPEYSDIEPAPRYGK